MKLLAPLALLACMLLLFGAVLWYVLFPLIPPQDGPFHWIVVLLVVLAGIGVGVLSRVRGSGARP